LVANQVIDLSTGETRFQLVDPICIIIELRTIFFLSMAEYLPYFFFEIIDTFVCLSDQKSTLRFSKSPLQKRWPIES